jgi:hypothetical protein
MQHEPPRALLDLPDGRTVEIRVVRQTLVGDRWRCQVEWSEGAGATYYQGRWADELRKEVATRM